MDVTGLFAHIPPWPCPAQQTLPEPWKAGRWLTLVLGRIQPLNPHGEELYPWEEEVGGACAWGRMPDLYLLGALGPSLHFLVSPPHLHHRKCGPACLMLLNLLPDSQHLEGRGDAC